MRLAFLTSTPQNIARGSGTFIGIQTLRRALEARGIHVELFAPSLRFPHLTMRRLLFNEALRLRDWSRFDYIVGFDMDGYRIAGLPGVRHVADIKGVVADELRFERGVTRMMLSIQARCERIHASRADLVLTTSRYSATEIERCYGASAVVVPELIDLAQWRIERRPAARFTVLSVCRFYPRKRLGLLVDAAGILRERVPELEVRIVGSGPACPPPAANVRYLGDLPFTQLQAEYASADLFCLPSVQEGFGIVFLEAMAAGVPIVAARAAAVPEVVTQGLLVEPGDAAALAAAIERLYRNRPELSALREAGFERVKDFDAPRVAARFLEAIRQQPAKRPVR